MTSEGSVPGARPTLDESADAPGVAAPSEVQPTPLRSLRSRRFDASVPRRKTLSNHTLLAQVSDDEGATVQMPSLQSPALHNDGRLFRSSTTTYFKRQSSADCTPRAHGVNGASPAAPTRALSFAEVMARLEQEEAPSEQERIEMPDVATGTPTSPVPSLQSMRQPSEGISTSHKRNMSSSSAAARQLARLSLESPLWSPGASIEDLFNSSASRDDLSLSDPQLLQEYKILRRRQAIIRELVTTELAFSEDMNIIVQEFIEHVDDCIGLGTVDTRIIFGSVGPVAEFANDFSFELVTAANPILFQDGADMPRWQEADGTTRIGSTFASFLGRLQKVYSNYCSGHEQAAARLYELQQNPDVAAWLAERHPTDRATSWDLASLMIKPVQRFLKYPLLLGSLLEATPKNHEDYWFIELSAKDMLTAAEMINKMQKRRTLVGSVERKAPFDIQAGLAKSIARRTSKVKQSAGLEPVLEVDHVYERLQESVKLQQSLLVSLRAEVTEWLQAMRQSLEYHAAFATSLHDFETCDPQGFDPGAPSWDRYSMAIAELQSRTLIELTHGLEREVFQPLSSLERAYSAPSAFMRKRNNEHQEAHRLRVKLQNSAISDPGRLEQYEVALDQYNASNATLILELPQLLSCTRRAMKCVIFGLTKIQSSWYGSWVEQLELLFSPGTDIYSVREPFRERFALIMALAAELSFTVGAEQRYAQSRVKQTHHRSNHAAALSANRMSISNGFSHSAAAATARVSSDSSESLSSLVYPAGASNGSLLGRVTSGQASSISSVTTSGLSAPPRIRSGSMNLAHVGGSTGHLPSSATTMGSRLSSRPGSNRNSYVSGNGGSSLHNA